jgi:hypothetical protein
MRKLIFLASAMVLFSSVLCFGQDNFVDKWLERSDKAKDEQPHWMTPVATTTPRLEQEYRYDQLWNVNTKGITTDSYDGGKGFEFIPMDKVQISFNLPQYLDHNVSTAKNGFGDEAFLVKYRVASADEKHGNYIMTIFFGWSIPTGSYSNGAIHPVFTPTFAYGKGYKNFDAQGTFGVGLPSGDVWKLGQTYSWNNAFQYKVGKYIWPEVEVNSSFISGGPNSGKKQTFITPGLIFGRYKTIGRVKAVFGGGYQVATTHYHTTNHNGIVTVRFPF